ncbi:TetR/AcrR family transcriptional regulator [Nocardia callitridis]|uniref:HTH tetR-type domain-containing protein n=1 Tax=Nocardia callitridis TaxID=648753 RepID=A0ABP9JV35_9NOCA
MRQEGATPVVHTSFAERHRAARDAVLASQRGRLLEAMVGCVSEKGYAATTLTDIVGIARVSRSTFYEHFANKEDCFVAAVRTAVEVMTARAGEEIAQLPADADAVTALETIIVTYCETVATEPDFARLALVEAFTVNQAAIEYHDLAADQFAALYRYYFEQARAADPTLPSASAELIALIPDALAERTRRVLTSEGAAAVPALAPVFIQLVTSVLGVRRGETVPAT